MTPVPRSAFDGPRKRQASALALEISEALPPPEAALHPSLSSGHAGLALFFAQLARFHAACGGPFEVTQRRAGAHLEAALDGLESVPFHASLFGGLAGVGWVAAYLERARMLRFPEELFHDIDAQLMDHLRLASAPPAEVMFGTAGIGVYALERAGSGVTELLFQVVECLAAQARRAETGIYWDDGGKLPGVASGGVWTGVSHGSAGIIGVLSRAFGAGSALAGECARAAMPWLIAQRLPQSSSHWFPNRTGTEQVQFAWCHGDLGIACSMQAYEMQLATPGERALFESLRRSVAELGSAEAIVEDMSLCHGRFGNAYLLHRLHAQNSSAPVERAAVRWWDAAVEGRRPGPVLDAFPVLGPNGFAPAASQDFLTGLVGIGLVALDVASDEADGWDAPLLTSLLGSVAS